MGLDSISYFISELFEKVSTPSIIIFPSGHFVYNQQRQKVDYTSTRVHTCKHAHLADTKKCTPLFLADKKKQKKSFLKTSLSKLQLHNSCVGVFFFFFLMPGSLGEVGDHFITHP